VLRLIGHTPLDEITRLDRGCCRLFVKLEGQNPGGSINDRPALSMGAILDPFSSFLGLRGIKTLPLHMERHAANALALATWLERHPAVERVIYPGLPSHPQRQLAQRQMKNGGGMVSVLIKGTQAKAVAVLERFKLFALAGSLSGIESLVGHPWTMSHGSVPEERRKALGITPNLLRLSVGIEDAEDLIDDLDQALAVL